MALKDIILGRFAWNKTRREKVPESLDGLSLGERRQAIHALVGSSVAPRSIHLRSGGASFSVDAGNGQILEVELRDASGVLYRLDCTSRPSMTLGEADKSKLLEHFLGFLGRTAIAVQLEPIAEERSGHQGLSPEILVADERRFGLKAMVAARGTDGPAISGAGLDLPLDDRSLDEELVTESRAGEEVSGPALDEAAPPSVAVVRGSSPLLRDYAGRLRGHVLQAGLRSDLAEAEVEQAPGIERFIAAASPALGGTLLIAYLGADDTVESYAVATDSGDATALRFRRSRAGKVFQEWISPSVNIS